MLLFYGLGNNETKYLQTKHNAGRIVLEKMVSGLGLDWQKQTQFTFAKTSSNQEAVYFLFSNGYMNTSGQPLAALVNYFKLDFTENHSNLIVLHDDSDQAEGQIKLLPAGSSGGHKGVQSIYDHSLGLGLSINQIWRLKIGIRPTMNRQKSETFVLSRLSSQEQENLENLSKRLLELLPKFISGDWPKLQTELNTKK